MGDVWVTFGWESTGSMSRGRYDLTGESRQDQHDHCSELTQQEPTHITRVETDHCRRPSHPTSGSQIHQILDHCALARASWSEDHDPRSSVCKFMAMVLS